MKGDRTSDYDFDLPAERIAQEPLAERSASRLMVVRRDGGTIEHRRFSDIVELIPGGDLLVLNTTRVMKARLLGKRASGAPAEIFLLKPMGDGTWEAMVSPGGKVRPGRRVEIAPDLAVDVVGITERRTRVVRLVSSMTDSDALERHGHVPLPPYIRRADSTADAARYQTVYARETGSVAAPTAGLHLTEDLLAALARHGVARADVVLHVGAGTFRPVDTDDPALHVMHEERYSIPAATAAAIATTRARGGRIWAVGTTSLRALESAADESGAVRETEHGETRLFIRPGYRFRVVDRLITNFHLPRSTLLMLVAALAGHELTMQAYREAVNAGYPKKESYALVDALKAKLVEAIPEEEEEKVTLTKRAFDRLKEEIFRDEILNARRRPDGRKFDAIRKITCETTLLPRVHGSALFTRGETQALATLTLGTKEDQQRLDLLFAQDTFKRFMLHYNFPPFSVGEVKPVRGPGRREIGHGALAERALMNLLPAETDFPYAMRLVSDILESNGSSSMATVCGGSLAMMDAGVPLKSACAGIAMGLVVGDGGKYSILTDIAGAEDHYGDMDFKVAGTRSGVTALQMDIKVTGISIPMMREALAQAKKARLEILDIMDTTLSEPRAAISSYAPRLFKLSIPTDKIRDLIGPGGKKIKSIIEQTGVKIDVHEDGTVHIFATSGAGGDAALQMVRDVTASAEIGKTYLGKVVRLAEFGAFVELFPGTDGLLHISEIAEHRVRDVRDELKLGDQVMVKVLAIEGNKIRLSRKALIKEAREKQALKKEAAAGASTHAEAPPVE